jgi:crossover junction endodeoxyribonuclease RuvC
MRLLGLDPGLRHTGWGVVEADANRLRFVACGVVDSDASAAIAIRLRAIYDGLAAVIRDFGPAEAAVEETVVNLNASSSLKLGHARGVVVLAAAHAGLLVSEYAAKRVKRAVTGTGAASKEQVAHMVGVLLPGSQAAARDASDALAVAICHAHCRATAHRLAAALEPRHGVPA